MESNQKSKDNASDYSIYNKGVQSPYVNYVSPVTASATNEEIYMSANPANSSSGVPMFPLYGYDNSDDIDNDLDYMKSLYPKAIHQIQTEIEDECDKLEYDGSCMFDEWPDKNHLESIVNVIYKRVENLDKENTAIQTEQLSPFSPPYIYGRCYGINCPNIPNYYYDGRPNWMRNLIEALLFNEMLNRRRRYRSRRRWY